MQVPGEPEPVAASGFRVREESHGLDFLSGFRIGGQGEEKRDSGSAEDGSGHHGLDKRHCTQWNRMPCQLSDSLFLRSCRAEGAAP